MSGTYRVGMHAPGEIIVWTIAAPLGVGFEAIGLIELSVLIRVEGQDAFTLTDWLISDVTEDSFVATYLPDGSEFTAHGNAKFNITLVLDGVEYRYDRKDEYIEVWL